MLEPGLGPGFMTPELIHFLTGHLPVMSFPTVTHTKVSSCANENAYAV